MTQPLDEQYLRWLYSQVASTRYRMLSRTYWNLLRHLYSKEFVWVVANDDNRAMDGIELRDEFAGLYLEFVDEDWMQLGCSVLEMLIAISRRLSFESGERASREWFWHLLKTLGIDSYSDAVEYPFDKVDDAVNTMIWRTYSASGKGGLFPLRHPREDQTKVELWYQLNAYLLEQE